MIQKDITSIRSFYRRCFSRILPWSIFFFIIGSFFEILNRAYNQGTNVWETDFATFYFNWFKNGGGGVLWFIPALMGLYLITPALIWVRKRVSFVQFCILTAAMLASTHYLFVPFFGGGYTTQPINWLKGIFFIGHYMLGYCIYTFCKLNRIKWLNAATFGILFIIAFISCAIYLSPYFTVDATSPLILNAQKAIPIILCALLFAFFNKVSLPQSRLISKVASISIIIYLSHNYLPLPIIRFVCLKWTGLWDTVYRDSFLLQFACYAIAIPFSVLFALFLQKSAQYFCKLKQKL